MFTSRDRICRSHGVTANGSMWIEGSQSFWFIGCAGCIRYLVQALKDKNPLALPESLVKLSMLNEVNGVRRACR